ncbi:MAG: L-aspartate oxidase [Planctomycetaceae bacterium]|nr:L-aspartate oxidase [Planctomycetaceae bacterium]
MDNAYLRRRYLLSFESRRLPHIFTDVLIVGAGGAGLRAGIEAARTAQVILATKGDIEASNTYHAQGGMAAVIDPADSLQHHIDDTLATGCGLCDAGVVEQVVNAAPAQVAQMSEWGCPFDMAGDTLELRREGGHSANRIVHANGDATGLALYRTLHAKAQQCGNLKIFENCFVIDLLTDPPCGGSGATCVGALTYHPRYGLQIIRAGYVILAAGGAGMLWRETSNPPTATADSISLAFRAGAVIADAEMMQFHPTTLYIAGGSRSLISEAVRGEGGMLVDRDGTRFMKDYHPMGDLAPRDVVSRAIVDHCARIGASHVFLDVRHIKTFADDFPSIDQQVQGFGIDPAAELIPVHPAAHYMIGGVQADLCGRTSIGGLLAIGEASSTGLHGANRLASNSLIEVLVAGKLSGELAAAEAAGAGKNLIYKDIVWPRYESHRTELDLTDIRNSLRSLMWRNVGIRREGQRLSETLEIIAFWGRYVLDKEFVNPAGWEIQNMLTASYIIGECALRRTETRGVHYREDFPSTDQSWARRQRVRRSEHQLVVE